MPRRSACRGSKSSKARRRRRLSGLATPDAVFVGGGASDAGMLDAAARALRSGGRLVVNAVTLETEALLLARHAAFGGELDPHRDLARGRGRRKDRLARRDAGDAMAMETMKRMTVHFIGAGPGAADLITVRGRDLIARCPVCLYAGSIVPRELLAYCPPGARIVDTAPLSLDEIDAEFVAAHAAGHDVARLHSGDLSIYSALAEQLRRLERRGIPYTLTPGVPAFAAAAAALAVRADRAGSGAERGADPRLRPRLAHAGERETRDLCRNRRDARHPSRNPRHRHDRQGADAVLWRRIARPRSWCKRARRQQRIIRGTLADIAAQVREARIERTALILVGRALAAQDFRDSALYDADYRRRFRGGAA